MTNEELTLLYNKWYKKLFQRAKIILGNKYIAEDIVHDCFIKLLKYESFKNLNHEEGAITIILRNTCIDYLLKKERVEKKFDIYSRLPIESNLISESVRAIIYEHLITLSKADRIVMELSLAGLTPTAIARKLNKTISTITNQKHHAIKLLQQNLKTF